MDVDHAAGAKPADEGSGQREHGERRGDRDRDRQAEGWLSIYAQRGALVRDPAHRQRLAQLLRADVHEQAEALRTGDHPRFTASSMRFHRALVELAGNGLMLEVYDRMPDRQQLSIVRSAGRITAETEA